MPTLDSAPVAARKAAAVAKNARRVTCINRLYLSCVILTQPLMRTRLWTASTMVLLLLLMYSRAHSQRPAESQAEQFRRMSLEAESRGLADPFKGITTN